MEKEALFNYVFQQLLLAEKIFSFNSYKHKSVSQLWIKKIKSNQSKMKIEFVKQVRAQLKCLRISTKRKKGGFINAIERAIRYKFIREKPSSLWNK